MFFMHQNSYFVIINVLCIFTHCFFVNNCSKVPVWNVRIYKRAIISEMNMFSYFYVPILGCGIYKYKWKYAILLLLLTYVLLKSIPMAEAKIISIDLSKRNEIRYTFNRIQPFMFASCTMAMAMTKTRRSFFFTFRMSYFSNEKWYSN